MERTKILNIGGLVAIGFDPTGRYLLVISHSGRGVFDTQTWERIARDPELAYPDAGTAVWIGPLAGQRLPVTEIDYATERLDTIAPNGAFTLSYEGGIVIMNSVDP
jgi:hypothetical protein